MKPAKRQGRTVTEYHLTDLGEHVAREMSMRGIVSDYQSMRTLQRKLDEETEELITWVEENPSQLLEFPESQEETLVIREESTDENESGKDDNEESPRVVKPRSTDQPSKTEDDRDGAADPEIGSEGEEDVRDDAQRQLSSPDVQEKMQEAARTPEDDDDDQ